MKKLSSPFARLLAVAGCALALGSCNRAEYAMLPKTSTYYGEATHRHVAAAPAAVVAAPIEAPIPALVAPVAAVAPAAPQAVAPQALATPSAAAATAVVAVPKPTLVQRMMAKKVMKKLDKITARMQAKDGSSTASTARIDGNLRTGLIFLLVGLIVSLFAGISGIFGVIGAILAVIGLVFIVLWLLDQA
ncbi:hypothetical protein [Hymenobacter nivis]|nr:hypothetical protein [Hymenobacter nivis]